VNFYWLISSFMFSPPRIIGMRFVRQSVCLSVTFRVRSITYLCIDGLPSNLVQILSSLRRCTVTLTHIHTSKVKVMIII